MQQVKFAGLKKADFYTTLRSRVNDYLKSNNLSRQANEKLIPKTIFMMGIYVIPYLLMVTGVVSAPWAMLGLCVVMGIGMSGIGLSIMHDANHGTYSKKKGVNDFVGYVINFLGGCAMTWKIQHNVLHHTYTNVEGMDEDIDPGKLMRFSPHKETYWFHKGQHIYAWFLYALMTLSWVTVKDFKQLFRYRKMDLLAGQGTTFAKEMRILIISKVLYYAYILVIPMLVLSLAWWQIMIGFVVLHFVAGFTLAIIFQAAHVMETSDYPVPEEGTGSMKNTWAVHQLFTTANFAPKNRFLTWFIGGLNYQVEHHLFPSISHVHYPAMSSIVEKTAHEYGLPYNVQPTFLKAILVHGKALRDLGRKSFVEPSYQPEKSPMAQAS